MRNTKYKKRGSYATLILGAVLIVTVFFLSFVIAYNIYSRESGNKDGGATPTPSAKVTPTPTPTSSPTDAAKATPAPKASIEAAPTHNPNATMDEIIKENDELRIYVATLESINEELQAEVDKYRMMNENSVGTVPTRTPNAAATRTPTPTAESTATSTPKPAPETTATATPKPTQQPADDGQTFDESMDENTQSSPATVADEAQQEPVPEEPPVSQEPADNTDDTTDTTVDQPSVEEPPMEPPVQQQPDESIVDNVPFDEGA